MKLFFYYYYLGAKRDVESKLYSICCFLRSTLGLGSDSGFISTNLPFCTSPSQRSANNSRASFRESPHRLNFSKNTSFNQISVTDNDIDLLKSTLMELVEKLSSTEKERVSIFSFLLYRFVRYYMHNACKTHL